MIEFSRRTDSAESGEMTDELGLCCDVVEKLQTTEWRVQFLHLGFDSSH